MPDAIITSTASTFGTISGTFAADQSTVTGTVTGIVAGTLSGSVGVPGPAGPAGAGVPAGGLTGQFLQKIDGTNYNTDWVTLNLSAYLTKAANLSDLTNFATARDNLSLGTLNTPTFAGVTVQGSGANVANLTPTSLSLNHATSGSFVIQPSAGITFPDTTIQTTAFNATAMLPYALIDSQVFTGTPSLPAGTIGVTAALGDNDTSLATTAFVQQELASGTANAKNLEVYVRNQTGSTLAAGAIVYINGATGNRPTVTLAQANNDANSAQTMGFVKTAIAHNGFGFVIVRGECENLDTSAVAEGTQLYLSPTVAGAYTTTKPSAPEHLVYVGIVIRSHPTQGVILVAVQNGYELDELHDVSITSPTNGQVLKYNSTTGLWYNGTDSAGVAWGGITGTLSSQTDLQTALDGKYSTTNPAGYITSSALTGYATETFVTSQGYITSAALSPYLTSATAASTYQTLSGMSSYLTTSAAASTYAPIASPTFTGLATFDNPGNYAISVPASGGAGYDLRIEGQLISLRNAGTELIRIGTGGIKYPDGVTQSVAYPGPSGFLLKADNLSGLANTGTARTNLGLGTMATETASNYLTTATAASTYQTLAGMSSYLTTATAASTYFTIASAANKADLASPVFTGDPQAPTPATSDNDTSIATTAFVKAQGYLTSAPVTSVAGKTGAVTLDVADVSGAAPLASPTFTGTPTLPTGTIAVTQSAGNNTTAVATTAFVTAAVPTFATFTTPGVNSTNTIVSPRVAIDYLMHPGRTEWLKFGSTATSGTGASVGAPVSTRSAEIIGPNAGVAGYAMAIWDTSFSSIGMLGMTRGVDMSARAWNKGVWASGRGQIGYYANNTYNGDANTTVRVSVGGKSAVGSGPISNFEPGFGWLVPGVGNAMQLQVSNGSAVTTVTASFTPTARQVFDWKMFSDGTGNVTLWINDSVVATTTAGPTTSTAESFNFYFEMVEQTASAGTRILYESLNSRVWWGV